MQIRETRERAFPPIDPDWIVFEDEALIALCKPVGVSSQEARPGAQDDFPARVRRFLAARAGDSEGSLPYLGIHQRLDRETSGVLVYAKAREANAGLAAQLESRSVDKRYVAAVSGWSGPERATLRHRLAKGPGGAMVVRGDGKEALTHVRVRARHGDRALLDLRIETGRTHQIRAQLAAAGAPIGGDDLYGGAPASRLMLHAAKIGLRHPLQDRALTIEAPLPEAIEQWARGAQTDTLDAMDEAQLRACIKTACVRRYGLGIAALREGDGCTTAFRLIHGAADGLPGLEVDVYDAWLCAHLHEEISELAAERVLRALGELGFAGVYVKRRPKRAQRVDDSLRAALAPALPVSGSPAPDPLQVSEQGTPLLVRLGDGLSTGLFLDQRDNRARVRALAAGKRVLNLFSYTGAFGIAAALGGAAHVWNVDASAPALQRAEAGLALLGIETSSTNDAAFRNLRADVFSFLQTEATRRARPRWDLIICDPPTFSSVSRGKLSRSGARRFASGSDWQELSSLAFQCLDTGGALLATSNDRRMAPGRFRAFVRAGATQARVQLEALRDLTPPEDFPPIPGQGPHLKGVLALCASWP